MLENISSLNSEIIIINYIFNNFELSNKIYNILKEEDFFYETTKKYFKNKKFLNKNNFSNYNVILSNLRNLIDKSKKRKMIKILFNIIYDLLYFNNIEENIYFKINILLNFCNKKKKAEKIDYFLYLKQYLFSENKYILTGYKKLDNIINGLNQGDLIILAGRPSIGKTSFALNILKNLIIIKKKILIFSLEMTTIQIFIRLLSLISEIKQENFKNNCFSEIDIKKISYIIKNLDFNNLIIKDCSSLSSFDIEFQLNYYKKINKNIDLILIDYIQLMKSDNIINNRVLEISEISRSLKLIAKNYNCVVIALSQLNRLVEQRNDKMPLLSDLRDSGSIEQDADIVIFLHKDIIKKNIINIIISKNRNGALGAFSCYFKNEITKFIQI